MLLVIDNYDSFVFNLVHYVQELGARTRVVRNDELSVDEALSAGATAVLMSPGPCTPDQAGICVELVRKAPPDLPMLGVCLGHQAIAAAHGAKIVSAQEIRHGKTSPVQHDGSGVFANLPNPITQTRYHSLSVAEDTLPPEFRITARADDGEIMGLSHGDRPLHGVQFHPESIASERGHDLLANFLDLAGVDRKAA